MGVPTTGLSLGRAQAALGQLVEPRDVLLRVARYPEAPDEPEPFAAARTDANALATQLAARIPSLRVLVDKGPPPESLATSIDGVPVPASALAFPVKANPDKRKLVVLAPGCHVFERVLELRERDQPVVRVKLEPDTGK